MYPGKPVLSVYNRYEHLKERYANDARVDFGKLHEAAVGPHPAAHFELTFTRGIFTDMVTQLMFDRYVVRLPLGRAQT